MSYINSVYPETTTTTTSTTTTLEPCNCGSIYIPKSNPDFNVRITEDYFLHLSAGTDKAIRVNGFMQGANFGFLHTEDVFLESGQVFKSPASNDISGGPAYEILAWRGDLDGDISFFTFNIENRIKVVIRNILDNEVIAVGYFGKAGETTNLDRLLLSSCNNYRNATVSTEGRFLLEIHSICEIAEDECCDNLPNLDLNIIVDEICFEDLCTTTTTTTECMILLTCYGCDTISEHYVPCDTNDVNFCEQFGRVPSLDLLDCTTTSTTTTIQPTTTTPQPTTSTTPEPTTSTTPEPTTSTTPGPTTSTTPEPTTSTTPGPTTSTTPEPTTSTTPGPTTSTTPGPTTSTTPGPTTSSTTPGPTVGPPDPPSTTSAGTTSAGTSSTTLFPTPEPPTPPSGGSCPEGYYETAGGCCPNDFYWCTATNLCVPNGQLCTTPDPFSSMPISNEEVFGSSQPNATHQVDIGQGVGTELKKILGFIGITSTPNCSCNAKAKIMNEKGVEWCKNNIDVIVSWLKEEASKRNLPFYSFIAKKLVKIAIGRAER
jgi:hypothetical protein